MIHQEPTLFPDLSVAENIVLGAPAAQARPAHRPARRMRRDAAALFDQLGVRIDPERLVRGLSIADQQLVEIAKALDSRSARVIIMDEPTAALTPTEVERLFGIVGRCATQGGAIVFISHRLEEVFALCERVTIMRDGRQVLTAADRRADDAVDHPRDGRPADMDALFPKVAVRARRGSCSRSSG